MIDRILSAVLTAALLSMAQAPALAATKQEREAAKRVELSAKVKAGIERLGTGPDARVEVKLYDARRVTGYVAAADASGFSVVDSKSGVATRVAYADVSKVKGHHLATGWKIAIGAGVLFALALILVWSGAIGDADR
jgi:hypothetical protein